MRTVREWRIPQASEILIIDLVRNEKDYFIRLIPMDFEPAIYKLNQNWKEIIKYDSSQILELISRLCDDTINRLKEVA